MSFKVEIEISGYGKTMCGVCTQQYRFYSECSMFKKRLDYIGELNARTILYRCPECLEAEIKYKEKENERTTI